VKKQAILRPVTIAENSKTAVWGVYVHPVTKEIVIHTQAAWARQSLSR